MGDLTGKVLLDIADMMIDTKQCIEYIFKPSEILTHCPDKTHQKTAEEHALFLLIHVVM